MRVIVMRVILLFIILLLPEILLAMDVSVGNITSSPVHSSKVILTIKTPDTVKQFTREQLEAIGLKRLDTSTFWPEDHGEFSGVLLRDLLSEAGIEDAPEIKVTALDDYTAFIPREDWRKWDVILATRHEEKVIPVRRKGPLRIIYPKDIGGEIANSEMRIRWIWAIKLIEPVH